MRIGIYGGTFDPPHLGHIAAASSAVNALGLEKLIMIPAGTPPHKKLESDSCSPDARLEMTRLAALEIPHAQVSDMETKRGGKSYTVDTVGELLGEYPGSELFILMGTDMFLSIESWKDFRRLIKLAAVAVFPRSPGEEVLIEESAAALHGKYGARVICVPSAAIRVSSSEIRIALPLRKGREALSDSIYTYIIKKRFYCAKPDLDWLREKACAMLSEKRVSHVKGCEEEAACLALRWGADRDEAREAAILHDITKRDTPDAHLQLCEKYGIITDNAEKADFKLLHSKTGAAAARDLFGISDEVYGAILWHTTGRAGMTLLEKIIYIADYIEPTRDFEGLEELRRLAYSDIDKAMIVGLRMSLKDMHRRGITPHERSVAALRYLENINR